ncbi:glycosyltransferase [Hymenobacter sp. YC55]|uniref:glycosyltransferase family 2 protein n=1 Tax=Hymenobacter sp. YC55 TaxID=3034019 RepID=UPI0023F9F333|nr:glycosyltransferase [Hymenobacter sp. YC55]MDF7810188.1 glycosyltransferase [Hymenobacter sp. YC55]
MSLNRPKVSVVIPNYNHALYLPKRIDSVLNQTFSDIEIILLDDCSLDNSSEIIKNYAALDKRIQPVFNTKNSGSVFKQWEKGLSLAKGEYVWIAESDDFAELDFLSTLIPLLDNDESVAFAYSDSRIVNEKGEPIGKISDIKERIFKTDYWDHNYIAEGKTELRRFLSLQCTVNNASAVLFRRSSIEAAGGVDTSFRYTGDWMMYIKLSLLGKIAYKAACLNNYREHGANASKASEANGNQLYERQKCFAYVYQSSALDNKSRKTMLAQSSNEYIKLVYLVVKERRQPLRLMKMMGNLIKISPAYYALVQYHSLRQVQYRAFRGINLFD